MVCWVFPHPGVVGSIQAQRALPARAEGDPVTAAKLSEEIVRGDRARLLDLGVDDQRFWGHADTTVELTRVPLGRRWRLLLLWL